MLAIEVQFLTGRYVATAHDDRFGPEWPPHPARLFSAMTHAWATAEEPDDAEREILQVFERLGPPRIAAPEKADRVVVTHYVPVNDPSVIGASLWGRVEKAEQAHAVLDDPASNTRQRRSAQTALTRARDVATIVSGKVSLGTPNPMPEMREKQARAFPAVALERPASGGDPAVTFSWPEAELDSEHRRVLDGLLTRVTRLGHSSTLVNCRLAEAEPAPTFVPEVGGATRVRTVSEGQLEALVEEFERHLGSSPRELPGDLTEYARADGSRRFNAPVATNLSAGWWAFDLYELDPERPWGARPEALVAVTTAVRDQLEGALDPGVKGPVLDHVHILGLPHLGAWGSGDLLGVGVVLGRGLEFSERRSVLAAIGRWIEHEQGGLSIGGLRLQARRARPISPGGPPRAAVRADTWGLAADTRIGYQDWVTATPIALPGRSTDPEEWISKGLEHLGVPRPTEIVLTGAPQVRGAIPANRYPPFARDGRRCRLTHTAIKFASPVSGLIVVGLGARLGLGLMRPLRARGEGSGA